MLLARLKLKQITISILIHTSLYLEVVSLEIVDTDRYTVTQTVIQTDRKTATKIIPGGERGLENGD